jgi:hypothetical protein
LSISRLLAICPRWRRPISDLMLKIVAARVESGAVEHRRLVAFEDVEDFAV